MIRVNHVLIAIPGVAALLLAVGLGLEIGSGISRAIRRSDPCVTWLELGTANPIVHVPEGSFDLSKSTIKPIGDARMITSERPTACFGAAFMNRERSVHVMVDGIELRDQSAICVQHAYDLFRGVWGTRCTTGRKEL